jgi:hypothetical protein
MDAVVEAEEEVVVEQVDVVVAVAVVRAHLEHEVVVAEEEAFPAVVVALPVLPR